MGEEAISLPRTIEVRWDETNCLSKESSVAVTTVIWRAAESEAGRIASNSNDDVAPPGCLD